MAKEVLEAVTAIQGPVAFLAEVVTVIQDQADCQAVVMATPHQAEVMDILHPGVVTRTPHQAEVMDILHPEVVTRTPHRVEVMDIPHPVDYLAIVMGLQTNILQAVLIPQTFITTITIAHLNRLDTHQSGVGLQ